MKDLIKQLILDFHKEPLPNPKKRALELPLLPTEIRKAIVFVGVRRCGKTWTMYQHMQDKLALGVRKEQLLYINFEDDRLAGFKIENFQDILTAYYDLYPECSNDSEVVFYFDEIHIIDGWEKFIRRLLDKEKMQLVISGSSAKMLSIDIATQLRGRCITQEIFPFSFQEFSQFHQVETKPPFSSKQQSALRHYAQRYSQLGGFPETLFLDGTYHIRLIQGYMDTVIFRDVVERHQIKNIHVVRMFLLHCLQNIASPLSITKIYQFFKSQGQVVGKNSLYDFLDYLTDAYALFAVPIFDFSQRKQQVNPKKIYSIDPGVIPAYSIKADFDQGASLENMVFLQLRRSYQHIFYYKTETNKEVDFVVVLPHGGIHLYQVSLSLKNKKTRDREVSALLEAKPVLNAERLFLITLDESEDISIDNQTIQCLPFWQWASSPIV